MVQTELHLLYVLPLPSASPAAKMATRPNCMRTPGGGDWLVLVLPLLLLQ
jgi:hypothetical protein